MYYRPDAGRNAQAVDVDMQEMRHSADVLAAGLLEVADLELSKRFFRPRVPQVNLLKQLKSFQLGGTPFGFPFSEVVVSTSKMYELREGGLKSVVWCKPVQSRVLDQSFACNCSSHVESVHLFRCGRHSFNL